MDTRSFSLKVSPEIGKVTAEYMAPANCRIIMTLAHGAGAGMHHSFMLALSNALAGLGIGTLRYNFPFMEQGKKRADTPAVAHQAVAAAINHARETYPKLPLYVSGKSFGGRMSSQYLAAHQHAEVNGIVFYGFPLHPAKKPSIERATHLKDVKQPMLFLQGTRDELATWDLIEGVTADLPKATLIKIEGADHAFKAGKKDVISILAQATADWTKA